MSELSERRCRPCEGDTRPLDEAEARALLQGLHADWRLDPEARRIERHYRFADFHRTMAFVNALAWIAHQEDHHPELAVSYNRCAVRYTTHAIGGLSDNDFICAAKIDFLLED